MRGESSPLFLNVEDLGTLTRAYSEEMVISGCILNITSKHDNVDQNHESTGSGMLTSCVNRPYRLSE